MSKIIKIATIAVFLGFIVFMAVSTLTKEEVVFSANENRNLEERPDLTVDSFVSGEYAERFELYFKDQFHKRVGSTKYFYKFQRMIGKPTINNISFGGGNWISSTPSGSKETYEEIIPTYFKKQADFLAEYAKNKEIPVYFSILPEKNFALDHIFLRNISSVNRDKFINGLPDLVDPYIKSFNLIESYDRDFTDKEKEELYYKTDHHWNPLGAYYGYTYIIDEIKKDNPEVGNPLALDELVKKCASEDAVFVGSNNRFVLGIVDTEGESTCNYEIADREIYDHFEFGPYKGEMSQDMNELLQKGIEQENVSYSNVTRNDYAKVIFKTKEPKNDIKMLVFSDSYFNAITSYFPSHFEETHILDLRHFNGSVTDYIEEHGINMILMAHNTDGIWADTVVYSQDQE